MYSSFYNFERWKQCWVGKFDQDVCDYLHFFMILFVIVRVELKASEDLPNLREDRVDPEVHELLIDRGKDSEVP